MCQRGLISEQIWLSLMITVNRLPSPNTHTNTHISNQVSLYFSFLFLTDWDTNAKGATKRRWLKTKNTMWWIWKRIICLSGIREQDVPCRVREVARYALWINISVGCPTARFATQRERTSGWLPTCVSCSTHTHIQVSTLSRGFEKDLNIWGNQKNANWPKDLGVTTCGLGSHSCVVCVWYFHFHLRFISNDSH